ncbi:hypothetical protein D1007_52674 [Hordeum vulgare]|nr:hypothetical protein D1007_52674 [Hordeum vulgare]
MAAVGTRRQFIIIANMDTHIRKINLSVVYTNEPVIVDNSINMLEQVLAEDDKYKVTGFDLEYTNDRTEHDQMIAAAQLCMRHHVLVYHYCLATRPCGSFARFVNSLDHRFAIVLKTLCR